MSWLSPFPLWPHLTTYPIATTAKPQQNQTSRPLSASLLDTHVTSLRSPTYTFTNSTPNSLLSSFHHSNLHSHPNSDYSLSLKQSFASARQHHDPPSPLHTTQPQFLQQNPNQHQTANSPSYITAPPTSIHLSSIQAPIHHHIFKLKPPKFTQPICNT